MDEAEFGRILSAGMGRAVSLLTGGDAGKLRHVLLHPATHYTAFDPAIEGDRSGYLFAVIEATGSPDAYRDAVLAALPDATANRPADAAHCFALAARFAARGDDAARAALYDAFAARASHLYHPRTGAVIGAAEIVALDGVAGFRFVAGRLGAMLTNGDGRVWFADGPLSVLERTVPTAEIDALHAATADAHVRAYIEEAQRHRAAVARLRNDGAATNSLTVEAISRIAALPGRDGYRARLARWGETASAHDLDRVAATLAHADDPAHRAAYARVFARRPYPADPAPLIALACEDDPALAGAALNALAHVAHPAVRELALSLLPDPRRRSLAVELLAANHLPGDAGRITALLAEDAPPRAWHWLGYAALAVFAAHASAAAVPALLSIYERTPCSRCRSRAVALLHALDALPRWMAAECRHDAHPQTREIAATYTITPVPPGATVYGRDKSRHAYLRTTRCT